MTCVKTLFPYTVMLRRWGRREIRASTYESFRLPHPFPSCALGLLRPLPSTPEMLFSTFWEHVGSDQTSNQFSMTQQANSSGLCAWGAGWWWGWVFAEALEDGDVDMCSRWWRPHHQHETCRGSPMALPGWQAMPSHPGGTLGLWTHAHS